MGILIEETKYNRSYSICLLLFVAVVVICLFDFFSLETFDRLGLSIGFTHIED